MLKNLVIEISANVAFTVIVAYFGNMPRRIHRRPVIGLSVSQDTTSIVINEEEIQETKKAPITPENDFSTNLKEIELNTLTKEEKRVSRKMLGTKEKV